MTGGWPLGPPADGPATAALLTGAAEAAEALAAGRPGALERLVAVAEALDATWGAEPGAGPGRAGSVLSRDELGDSLVTLAAAGVDADERSLLALRLAAMLREARADL